MCVFRPHASTEEKGARVVCHKPERMQGSSVKQMDPITKVAVEVEIQTALNPYRTRADEDAILAEKATTAAVAGLKSTVDTLVETVASKAEAVSVLNVSQESQNRFNAAMKSLNDAVSALTLVIATKADSSSVYTKNDLDAQLSNAITNTSSSSQGAVNQLAATLTTIAESMTQNLNNVHDGLVAQISGKISTDAWPALVSQAEAAAARSANDAISRAPFVSMDGRLVLSSVPEFADAAAARAAGFPILGVYRTGDTLKILTT